MEKVDFSWAYEVSKYDKNYWDRQDEGLNWYFYDFSDNYQIEVIFKQIKQNSLERGNEFFFSQVYSVICKSD